jgi:hypothetical protein
MRLAALPPILSVSRANQTSAAMRSRGLGSTNWCGGLSLAQCCSAAACLRAAGCMLGTRTISRTTIHRHWARPGRAVPR